MRLRRVVVLFALFALVPLPGHATMASASSPGINVSNMTGNVYLNPCYLHSSLTAYHCPAAPGNAGQSSMRSIDDYFNGYDVCQATMFYPISSGWTSAPGGCALMDNTLNVYPGIDPTSMLRSGGCSNWGIDFGTLFNDTNAGAIYYW